MPEDENFDRYGFLISRVIVLAILLASVSVVVLSVYGAVKLYYRSDDIELVKSLNSRIVHQELLVKTLGINIAAANTTAKSAVDEAQKLRRAHKWVGIFRSVLPECIDDSWNGEVKEDENKSP